MAALTRLINPRCPCCGKKALESHRSRPDDHDDDPIPAERSWLWTACVSCGKHFKEQHFGDGKLHEVSTSEWTASVSMI